MHQRTPQDPFHTPWTHLPFLDAEAAYRRERLLQDWRSDSWVTRLRRHLSDDRS